MKLASANTSSPVRLRKRPLAPTVKSASRALELMEVLGAEHDGLVAMEIARRLDMPQSSTSVLLRSLVELGFVKIDKKKRTYLPTARVALIGSRVESQFFGGKNLLQLLNEVSMNTEEQAFLGIQNGVNVRILQAAGHFAFGKPQHYVGALRPLATTASGRLILSKMPKADASSIIARFNAETDKSDRVQLRECLSDLQKIRERGYALSLGKQATNAAVAIEVPQESAAGIQTISIGGCRDQIVARQHDLVAIARATISQFSESPESTTGPH
ncbi:helix-turn-helix domain-containing protein [Sedimentitalea sp.]|uniref:IclR family transcriptional regulator n=1 Tax=Sedimentitalea sp. TaxID=2048915 RepID=UPI003296DFF2